MNAKCMATTPEIGSDYPLRRLARAFTVVGAVVVAYAAALVAIAVESRIIEF